MDNNKIFEKTKMKIAISNDGKIDIMDLKVVNEKNEKVFATRELETEEMTSLYKTEQEARDNYTSYNGSYSETTFKIYLSNCNGIAHNENECVETSDGRKFYPAGRSDGDGMISVKELVIF